MPLLLSLDEVAARRAAAAGPLASLADGLAAELAPLLEREPFIPEEKAVLTRLGGRCPTDGTTLEFDPFSPQAHRCPRCGERHTGEPHYRMWLMWYQLWLAERAVHAAVLHLLRGSEAHAGLARTILGRLAEQYERYPNRDNALGPTRPFFSTYLESIWLLQLTIALDALEMAKAAEGMGDVVRERVIAPSRALIASYDEGGSNRQVWNAAALLAAALVLGDAQAAQHAVGGGSGLVAHLAHGLLPDGTWYEGENYHQFAHRGLWYGVTMAERAGLAIPPDLLARFHEGFASPFVVALPDMTLPSRRDSQYAISLRQWRYAEVAELGFARTGDRRLLDALARLYHDDIDRRPTGRDRSAAESERNVPATALGRADLGWRSLLHARPELPPLATQAQRSALLEGQGLAILRREAGRVWIALDYGHSGGGHGHPDRLGLLLGVDDVRWLDDFGTGSYVDRSLHWYRSTLAHNAPLVNGRSQQRVHGVLRAWEERGGAGWVRATVDDIAPGVTAERTIVALPDYMVDVLSWSADEAVVVDLPIHLDGEMLGVTHWKDEPLTGGGGLEDGFDFAYDCERADRGTSGSVCLRAREGDARIEAHLHASGAEWWRACAPGPPGAGDRRFFIVRCRGTDGRVIAVWSWRAAIARVEVEDDAITVGFADGERHRHFPLEDRWRIAFESGDARSSIDLEGVRAPTPSAPAAPVLQRVGSDRNGRRTPPSGAAATSVAALTIPTLAAAPAWPPEMNGASFVRRVELGESDYRRSELTWSETGRPTATVCMVATGTELVLDVVTAVGQPRFVPAGRENPFDNEAADIDGDSVQLYFLGERWSDAPEAWVLVPECGSSTVRARSITGHPARVRPAAEWRPLERGYALRVRLPLAALGDRFRLGLIVNHTLPDRARRAGQLVLGGAAGEWIWLRGDRHPVHRFVSFAIAHD